MADPAAPGTALPAVPLSTLLAGFEHRMRGAAGDPSISSITHDSRRVKPGALFAALPGDHVDGRAFTADAIARGASAVIGAPPVPEGCTVPYVEVVEPRVATGLCAAALAGQPAAGLTMVGVTGTSGKTTTATLVDRMIATAHPARGLIGTIEYRVAGETVPAPHTTPESTDLQEMLGRIRRSGGTAAVMECSSHALALDRLTGCLFDVAVFTNLSRDHLDFHSDFKSYFAAKRRLFDLLKPAGLAVVNADDPWGSRLLAELPREQTLGFTLRGAVDATLRGTTALRADGQDLTFNSTTDGRPFAIHSRLYGMPNAENIAAAVAVGFALGLEAGEIAAALSAVNVVPGRLEAIPNRRGITVFVDYAHKPAALEGVLRTARPIADRTGGRVIVVFGCGGNRDRGKRPEMGRIAARLADLVFITTDNSRDDDPLAIRDDIFGGVVSAGRTATWILDRAAAIAAALDAARPGDVVILAGKGHETYQLVRGVRTPHDDRVVAASILSAAERAATAT